MKAIGCFCVLLLALCCSSARAGSMEEGVLNFLEELRKRMCHPIPKFGLPALDPMQKAEGNFSVDGEVLQGFEASATNLEMVGLSAFVVNNIKFPSVLSQKFAFDITFPSTRVQSDYEATGSLLDAVDINGKGDLRGKLENLRVSITCSTRLGKHLSIRNLKIQITIGDINVLFQDLIPDERINDFAHSIVNELGIELLNEYWEMTHADVEAAIQKRVNEYAAKYPLSKLIGLLTGSGSGEPIFGPEDPPGDCMDEKALFITN